MIGPLDDLIVGCWNTVTEPRDKEEMAYKDGAVLGNLIKSVVS